MALPIQILPIVERWDCHQCGFCCQGSIVPLTSHDVERLQEQGWAQHPDYRGIATTVRRPGEREKQQLAQRADGSCVFLMPDGLCRIHKELGFAAKPLICRMFPLQLIPHEKHAVLTLRRACPSAAADKGRPLQEFLPSAQAYADEGGLLDQRVAAPPIKPGEASDWPRARIVFEALRRLQEDARYPPIRRIVHGLEFCRLLQAADLQGFTNQRLAELVTLLEQHIAEEAARHFATRSAPARSACILFRQTALEVVRLHPRLRHPPSWKARFRLVDWALRMTLGKGKLPNVHPHFPPATFSQLEEPLGRLDPLFYDALARYVATTAASYQYAIAHKEGWSIVESYRQLALLYPLALWLLRWVSAGREPTTDDLYEIICALDRAHGYAPLTGARQRRRLQALTRLDALPTLVCWYGR